MDFQSVELRLTTAAFSFSKAKTLAFAGECLFLRD
jgi:hypothetical protein